ncbi:MAG: hypothetical protein AUG54_04550 [Ktedonobacter sp. 13_1_20CM_4_53_7]|nr:MAG: hypothetical protein AUG54_04550 [Ktedonobacter sp. 13_1_20CM_4_53_7]
MTTCIRHLEIMRVTLSAAKGLASLSKRSFAALRMTAGGCVILSAAKDLWPTSGESPDDDLHPGITLLTEQVKSSIL